MVFVKRVPNLGFLVESVRVVATTSIDQSAPEKERKKLALCV
jgi:hypothetical protein